MYSPRLYKYKDSYVLYIPITGHAFGSVLLTHTLLVLTHTHDVSAPWVRHGTFVPFFVTLCQSCEQNYII